MPDMEQLDIDLPEIQEIDPHAVIRAKLQSAFSHLNGEFIVEDTSLYFNCLHGLPGPLIKWFMKTIGNDGLTEITEKFQNNKAVAKTIIGYAKSGEEFTFFEGSLNGTIVKARGEFDFGWGPIFVAEGLKKTFAEITREEKYAISMRKKAFEQLKEFLNKNK